MLSVIFDYMDMKKICMRFLKKDYFILMILHTHTHPHNYAQLAGQEGETVSAPLGTDQHEARKG